MADERGALLSAGLSKLGPIHAEIRQLTDRRDKLCSVIEKLRRNLAEGSESECTFDVVQTDGALSCYGPVRKEQIGGLIAFLNLAVKDADLELLSSWRALRSLAAYYAGTSTVFCETSTAPGYVQYDDGEDAIQEQLEIIGVGPHV